MSAIAALLKTLLGGVFDDKLVRGGLIAAALAALVGWFVHDQRAIGAAKATANTERKTNHAINLGNSGARGSLDGRVRGTRDPSYRGD